MPNVSGKVSRTGTQLRSRLWRASVAEEVDAELDFHVDMLVRELVEERGMDPAAARAEAVRRFGGDLAAVKHECRDIGAKRESEMRRTEYIAEMRQDAAFAVRQLIKTPAFTLIAVLTLALGIGATTAIFSVLRGVVLRPFPFAHPERVTFVWERWTDRDGNVSDGNFWDWTQQSRSFAAWGALRYSSFILADAERPERVAGAFVTSGLFPAIGIPPLVGRAMTPDEDEPGKDGVVVLAQRFWERRFAADPRIVGRTIRLGGRERTVVGVMPASFDPTLSGEDLWVPLALSAERKATHDGHHLMVVGLLKDGVARERAQAEMEAIMRGLAERYPQEDAGRSARVASAEETLIGDYRERLFLLLGAVGFVLLIACGNVANLLLARGAARAKELAIRAAIGAGRGRIVRQLLTEALVLAAAAAAAGLALAAGGVRVLVAAAPPGVPRIGEARVDGVVLAFALAVAAASSLAFGLVPALRAARSDLQGALREGGRSSGASARDRVRAALVTAETALAVTLVIGAGLLVRSAVNLARVEPGFDPRGVLMARVALPEEGYRDPAAVMRAFTRLALEMRQQPGVRAAAITSQAPLGPGGNSNGLIPEGKAIAPENAVDARLRIITPEYFATLGIPLVAGRVFSDRDVAGAERVTVVSASLAKRLFPDGSALGKRLVCCEGAPDDPRWKTIVGVVGDVRSRGPAVDVRPEFYLPIEQVPSDAWEWVQRTMTLVARTAGASGAAEPADPAALTGAMRAALRRVDPAVPLYSVQTMEEAARATVAEARFNTALLAALGIVGLVLAAVGVYGVIAYFVGLRAHEIGVRMALGATAADILALMTWQGVRPVLAGAGLGTAVALGVTRLLRGSLHGVSATDPATFALAAALLVAVGGVASLLPARRATRVSPTRALQEA